MRSYQEGAGKLPFQPGRGGEDPGNEPDDPVEEDPGVPDTLILTRSKRQSIQKSRFRILCLMTPAILFSFTCYLT